MPRWSRSKKSTNISSNSKSLTKDLWDSGQSKILRGTTHPVRSQKMNGRGRLFLKVVTVQPSGPNGQWQEWGAHIISIRLRTRTGYNYQLFEDANAIAVLCKNAPLKLFWIALAIWYLIQNSGILIIQCRRTGAGAIQFDAKTSSNKEIYFVPLRNTRDWIWRILSHPRSFWDA